MGEKSFTGHPRVTVGPYCKGATSKSSVADPVHFFPDPDPRIWIQIRVTPKRPDPDPT